MGASLGARVAQADEELVGSQNGDGGRGKDSRHYFTTPPAAPRVAAAPWPAAGRRVDYPCEVPLDLVVPSLFPPPEAPTELRALRLPALESLLADAQAAREEGGGRDAWLLRAFGLPASVSHAAVSLAGEGLPREGRWLHADPVHLAIGQDAVALRGAAALAIDREEANALVTTLQAHFEPEGLAFLSPAPDRWYVRVPAEEVPATTPLPDALGRNIFGLLPRGRGRINWPSAVTEAQMLFSSHPVNAQREAQRRRAVNGVWFWGEGDPPAMPTQTYHAVVSDDLFVRGLARLSGASGVVEGGRVLVVIDAAQDALRQGDGNAWIEAVRSIEAEWFAHAARLRREHGEVRLVVPGDAATRVFTLRPPRRLRLFSRPRPFVDHA